MAKTIVFSLKLLKILRGPILRNPLFFLHLPQVLEPIRNAFNFIRRF